MNLLENVVINKELARRIGLKEALVYGKLLEIYVDAGSERGGFPCDIEELVRMTPLSIREIKSTLRKLQTLKLVDTSDLNIGWLVMNKEAGILKEILGE